MFYLLILKPAIPSIIDEKYRIQLAFLCIFVKLEDINHLYPFASFYTYHQEYINAKAELN